MTTELTPYTGNLDMMTLGKVLARSGYFQDAREEAQAIVKVLAGAEMGIGAIAAMTGIYIVKGRVTLSANLMAAQIKRSGRYNYRITRMDDTGCEITYFEGGQEIGRSAFTDADAKAAGLLGGDNWRKFPRNMYFARAMSNGAKWYCPDVFSGPVYTPDELRGEDTALPPQPPVDVVTGEVIEQNIGECAFCGFRGPVNADLGGPICVDEAACEQRQQARKHSDALTRLKRLRDGLAAIGGKPDEIMQRQIKAETLKQIETRCESARAQIVMRIEALSIMHGGKELTDDDMTELEGLEDEALIAVGHKELHDQQLRLLAQPAQEVSDPADLTPA